MIYRAEKCPCGHRMCSDWHVYPVAWVQGVKFTEGQALWVAALLNAAEAMEKTIPPAARSLKLESIGFSWDERPSIGSPDRIGALMQAEGITFPEAVERIARADAGPTHGGARPPAGLGGAVRTRTPEEIASHLVRNGCINQPCLVPNGCSCRSDIAAALRAYADERLEEAAKHIEAESNRQDTNYLDYEEMCRDIRALKSRRPKPDASKEEGP